jgi:hypothetical protein
MKRERGSSTFGSLLWLLWIWPVASWLTHVIVCLKAGDWGFLIAGALFFPVAIVHGTGIWFGVW